MSTPPIRGVRLEARPGTIVPAQGQFHRRDDMVVADLARMYPTATGRELQQAMMEGSPHIGERKAGHVEDYTRRTVRRVWERLGRDPEPWMCVEEGH